MMAFRSLIWLGSLGVSIASLDDLCAKQSNVQVETMVYSGTPNPVFELGGQEWHDFCALLPLTNRTLAIPSCRVLGFTGWKICARGSKKDCIVVRGEMTLDGALFEKLRVKLPETPTQVTDHIFGEVKRLHNSNGGDLRCARNDDSIIVVGANCRNVPIKGSDDPTKVHYDPSNDDGGCFVQEQGENNCYDYGNDIVTNTFAQPGRGSGVCPPNTRPCVKNNCDAIKNAAISDGLEWVGNDLPTDLPKEGHYVSLHVWPNSNFHWIRMDADKYWSHKPGGTAVRNVDNNNEKITDPGKADFSPWTQHCGYMRAVPSRSTINLQSIGFINV